MKPSVKILFADDDFKYSRLLKEFLVRNGYDVTYAGNGRIALDLFDKVNPNVVLLDVNMPEANGFEVAEAIRKKNAKVLIFFLTDRSDKTDRLKGFQLKGNDYLAKPFYPEELLARIEERLGHASETVQRIYKVGNTSFHYTTNELITGNTKTIITSRQADILRLLIESINETVSRDLLLNTVWGADNYTNSLALNVQITYLRRALQLDKTLKIISVVKKGYMLCEKL
ncbi:MAG TPA: DNA-binding response regulator [Porphyromonadaceae bacterium]|jgi:DNA-binding response OmpR family regulator|nr:DNA-binding response regulator [Porphyromonadaceae bacterium]HBK33066.1 DNA-binding response regulator [Porphyromonadaceae bacterium]HBL34910.1 DNA-binding response regulator [Porphyromonadaceae bacterium]HBX19922.1 DNA-binding response regulator [Porphyromonadaceae bacterium]HCM21302.1 DNA-binding response regulator [Porphyromonadaceae bacterium]